MTTPGNGVRRTAGSWGGTPTARIGWVAVIAAIVGLASWIVLPLVTTLFRETVPVTDTVVMPIIGVTLTLIAAVLNVLALTAWRQRNVLNLIAALLTVPTAIVFLVFLIGEGLSGA